jgi:glycosyltransferase involved in cell wall biosynthesis
VQREADAALLLEGTYPYVPGGVSSWVHDILRGLPEQTFALYHLGAQRGAYGARRYEVPPNVTGMSEHYMQEPALTSDQRATLQTELARRLRRARASQRSGSRLLEAIRRIHLDDRVDDELLADLTTPDLEVEDLLHGDAAFEVITELYRAIGGGAPFVDFFWHFRAAHVPLIRMLRSEVPAARVYHSVSTGYAGLVAAIASKRTGRPLLLTEHGIYARERDMELARATWIREPELDPRVPVEATSPLRKLWSRFFRKLSRIAYHQSARIVTLSEINRKKQLADGADAARTEIVANGVDVDHLAQQIGAPVARAAGEPVRIGFVGRVVPIKDVISFIKACDIALRDVRLDIRVIGPEGEDAAYAARCRELVGALGREQEIQFVGPKRLGEIYGRVDVVVLTSFSEGQPLVILEAHAVGVPCIATDVGACREMLEGRDAADRALGPSGIVTTVGAPEQTAAAMVRLARDHELRRRMGAAGRARVLASYTKTQMLEAYRALYRELGGR